MSPRLRRAVLKGAANRYLADAVRNCDADHRRRLVARRTIPREVVQGESIDRGRRRVRPVGGRRLASNDRLGDPRRSARSVPGGPCERDPRVLRGLGPAASARDRLPRCGRRELPGGALRLPLRLGLRPHDYDVPDREPEAPAVLRAPGGEDRLPTRPDHRCGREGDLQHGSPLGATRRGPAGTDLRADASDVRLSAEPRVSVPSILSPSPGIAGR